MLNSWTGLYGEARGVQSGSGLHIVMNESSPLVLNVQKSATSTFLDESRTVILPHPILVSMECQPGTANGSAEWQCGPRLDVQRGDRADKQGVPAPGVVSVPDALPDRARDAAALQVGQPPHVQPELDGDDHERDDRHHPPAVRRGRVSLLTMFSVFYIVWQMPHAYAP
jgi:hypothetical protein